MISSDEAFAGTFPYTPHYSEVAGFRMHYIDEGLPTGEVVLCLHGEPTWGYLFRHLVEALKPTHRVIVPDHMGFGKSETPKDRTYWLQDHVGNLEQLVLELDLKNITIVMHDFGGPTGMGLAIRHPDRIARLIAINTAVPFGQEKLVTLVTENARTAPWFRWILKANQEGTLETVLGQLGYNILSTLKLNGFERNDLITETWLSAYGAHFATSLDCAGAIGWAKGFATGAHHFAAPDPATAKAIRALPALAIWGTADRTLPAEYFLPLFTEIFPNAPVHRIEGAGHFSLEDAPQEIADIVVPFLALP
jgi:haloalkane dehalogenase